MGAKCIGKRSNFNMQHKDVKSYFRSKCLHLADIVHRYWIITRSMY